jgi:hypothetical protein
MYFRQKKMQKLAFLTRNKAKLCKFLIVTLFFVKKRQFFRRKLAKIAENCDHNIDPWCTSETHLSKLLETAQIKKQTL